MSKNLSLENKINNNLYIKSTLSVLNQVKTLANYYLTSNDDSKDEILLSIYGILQTLFVGVDALYDYVRALTDNKYLININQNERLHELKFIRNDVVGHPTSRSYSNNKIGFCILNLEKLTKDKISYDTYLLDNKTLNSTLVEQKEVSIFELIEAYLEEEAVILNQVDLYFKKPYSKNIVNSILKLEEMYLNSFEIKDKIDEVIAEAISYDADNNKHQNRLIWRLDLLKNGIEWETDDNEINNLIDYIIQFQLQKILQIALDITGQYKKLRRIKIPYLLKEFYKAISKNPNKILPLINHLHDSRHPFFKQDILELEKLIDNYKALKVIDLLKNLDDEKRIYLLGSVIKRYNKKN
ncbi:MAG: hypothetical protein ACOX5X_03790 [Acholeplasmataceae bacterium]|jgi:hypothetical protein